MSRGRHRSLRHPFNFRRVSRISVVLAAGGAGIAAPLLTAGSANAASAPAAAKVQAHSSAAQTQAASKAAQQSKAEGSDASGSYVVVGGDSLYRIATDRDVKGGWKAVYDANRKTVGDDPGLIRPGQKLTLPSSSAGAEKRGAPERADRSAERSSTTQTQTPKTKSTNLDGWIKEALGVMKQHGIPGTYEGIHRNIMRESGGNPDISNNWDINAQNGTPSIGLLQVIKPTFDTYHVEGTANDQRDPVANIVAACNYAAKTYGSIDNVNGPY
ncbi:transglycosylase SLT domain-containing protein [Streptomyces sp. NBC_01795]|uniref:transglycosylase SLT domain-containing protein n=1 Tax=unclassified Streptomyces TaxID=2593676 RepID=UPI002DDB94E3|nr:MULTISPECIES: transglycosylase SLT domain-containing protein [unclassified Streptomyces]WSA95113.1 transglycosylase SLT domain-containing protein [Streptomyces sp. NBC_01795]WSB79534.1 transglycosylase SLT domain-containing protein [Streptomyces sp. NBC_01775]